MRSPLPIPASLALAAMDGCSMGLPTPFSLVFAVTRGWLGVTSAEALTPAWAICYQRRGADRSA
ncbi:MAG: hypothetical protein IJK06_05410 [Clostridia bacterium]|nr:hypothetical protein [Clostridia bacterium]